MDAITDMAICDHAEWSTRNVTLVCGPPGSGKSTMARELHGTVVELEQFVGDARTRMRMFGRTVYRLGRKSNADAAVVRGAPSIAERQHQESLCHPARTIVLLTPPAVCHERITARGRPTAAGEHGEVDRWWAVWISENTPTDNPWGF